MPNINRVTPLDGGIWLVSDESNSIIKKWADKITDTLSLYPTKIFRKDISGVNSYDSGSKLVVFLVTMETDKLYNLVRRKVAENKENHMVLLYHSYGETDDVDAYIRSIKKLIKHAEKEKAVLNDSKRKSSAINIYIHVLKVLNIDCLADWWPEMLKFLFGQSNARPSVRIKEIGAYIPININSNREMMWFSEHRRVLEDEFQVKCSYGPAQGGDKNVSTYVKNSNVVVLCVHCDEIQEVDALLGEVKGEDTALLVYVKQISKERLVTLTQDPYGFRLHGDGALEHYIGLLNLLGLVDLKRKPDQKFYSSVKDDNFRQIYKPKKPKIGVERAITSLTSRSGVFGEAELDEIDAYVSRGPSRMDVRPTEDTVTNICLFLPPSTTQITHEAEPSAVSVVHCTCTSCHTCIVS